MVKIPVADTTPPTVNLDIYNIPLQPGSSSQPNPQSIHSACCDITVQVKKTTVLSLIAGGFDNDGGVMNIKIFGDITAVCDLGNGLGQKKAYTILQQNPDTTKQPGDYAEKNRVTAMNLRIQDYACGAGATLISLSGTLQAAAVNFHQGSDITKSFTFSLQ